MSKISMPEPVAWMFDEANQIGGLSTRLCWARHGVPPGYGQNHNGLVTVETAEAYATAKVREALEEAIMACLAHHDETKKSRSKPYYDGPLDAYAFAADAVEIIERRIRALLPSTPA